MVMMMNVYAYNGVFNHGDGDVSRKPPIALSAIARTHKPFPDCDDCEDVTILKLKSHQRIIIQQAIACDIFLVCNISCF